MQVPESMLLFDKLFSDWLKDVNRDDDLATDEGLKNESKRGMLKHLESAIG